jgi:hypothetical protein
MHLHFTEIFGCKAGYTWTDYKTNAQIVNDLKNNAEFGQITGIQEKLDTTCK